MASKARAQHCKEALSALEELRRGALSEDARSVNADVVEAFLFEQEVRIKELEEWLAKLRRREGQ